MFFVFVFFISLYFFVGNVEEGFKLIVKNLPNQAVIFNDTERLGSVVDCAGLSFPTFESGDAGMIAFIWFDVLSFPEISFFSGFLLQQLVDPAAITRFSESFVGLSATNVDNVFVSTNASLLEVNLILLFYFLSDSVYFLTYILFLWCS